MLASFLVCAKRLDEPALALRDKNRLPVFATKRQISRFFAFQRNLLLNRSVWFHDGNRTLLDSSYKQPSGDICAETVDRVGLTLTKQNAPRAEIVDLNEAIVEVIALTYSEAVKTGVTVSTRLAPQLPRVQGDRVQLQQVMLNLIVNAIQAMSGIGEGARELQISIDAVPSEGGVRVGVRDTGPGLSPESLPRLFEPFYTTKPEGMGLSVCRSIIKAHRGRLWAFPCEPQGALFQFTIPAT